MFEGGVITIGPGDLSLSLRSKSPEKSYDNRETMGHVEMIAKKANERRKGVLVPIWNKPELSIPDLCKFQRDHLVSKGIRMFYECDLTALADLFSALKNIRA